MHKLRAVFWDVDGTIADTELCGHRIAFNLAFKDFDLDWYWNDKKYIDLLKISGGFNRIIHYRNEINSQISDSQCSKIQSRKRVHYKDLIQSGKIKTREGVLRLIKELSSLDIEQFIVTTSGRDSLEPFLQTSLSSYINLFSRIITYEDVSKHKPYPDAYNLAVKFCNRSRISCIAIEDSIIGIKAARAANINCLMTLPPWVSSHNNIPIEANSCVDSLGNQISQPKVIYGKPLISKVVDYAYLTKIIN